MCIYQTIYHGYEGKQLVYCSIAVGNQCIIAIRHLRGLWYMANISRLSVMMCAENRDASSGSVLIK